MLKLLMRCIVLLYWCGCEDRTFEMWSRVALGSTLLVYPPPALAALQVTAFQRGASCATSPQVSLRLNLFSRFPSPQTNAANQPLISRSPPRSLGLLPGRSLQNGHGRPVRRRMRRRDGGQRVDEGDGAVYRARRVVPWGHASQQRPVQLQVTEQLALPSFSSLFVYFSLSVERLYQ